MTVDYTIEWTCSVVSALAAPCRSFKHLLQLYEPAAIGLIWPHCCALTQTLRSQVWIRAVLKSFCLFFRLVLLLQRSGSTFFHVSSPRRFEDPARFRPVIVDPMLISHTQLGYLFYPSFPRVLRYWVTVMCLFGRLSRWLFFIDRLTLLKSVS